MKINLWKNIDDWVKSTTPIEILGVLHVVRSVADGYCIVMNDGINLVLPSNVVMELIREDE